MSTGTVPDMQETTSQEGTSATATGGNIAATQNAGAQNDEKKLELTQKEIDDANKRLRFSVEPKTTEKLLAALGLKPGDETKLESIKAAYDASLTEAERNNEAITSANERIIELEAQVKGYEGEIAALYALSGVDETRAKTMVKMAAGLVSDEVTIADAVKTVAGLLGGADAAAPESTGGSGMPQGAPLNQAATRPQSEGNPFKAGPTFNMTEQGRLINADPDKARRLAAEAGSTIKF